MGESDEVAKAAVFLASDDSSFVTGIGLFADGALVVVDFVMEAGAALFSAELAMHAFTGERIFLFAAPIGGTTMMLSWVALAVVFATASRRTA
jgi:uncharacterized membrane protein YgdD (TMEM256/DUF423 family)